MIFFSCSTGDNSTPTPSAIGNFVNRKRKRVNEGSTQNTAVIHMYLENRAESSHRIQQIAGHLRDVGDAVSEILKLDRLESAASSNKSQSTSLGLRQTTSIIVERKLYGRDKEMSDIVKLMTSDESNDITVLPIVGSGGVGKTTLAQLVSNDPIVEKQFEHRIWVCVSNNFNEVRLTREMLDFVSQERHEGINSFAKLQEMLKRHIKLKKFLLVLDHVWPLWDDMNVNCWDKLLAPLKSNQTTGNMILVTTRNFFGAKDIGTVASIHLGALKNDDFLLLFKACAFCDEKYNPHPGLMDYWVANS